MNLKYILSSVCLLIIFATFAMLPMVVQAQLGTVTVAEIMEQRDTTTPDVKKPRYCSGGVFKPCVCAKDVTKRVLYRTSVRECGRKAAIILTGSYAQSFSVVLRDAENKDRVPFATTVNGCSFALAQSVSPPNRCSVFKAQKVIKLSDDRGPVRVHCMGASGGSAFGKRARRMTVKLADSPNDSNDPIARLCLNSPTKNLN